MLIRTFADVQTLIEAGELSDAEQTLIGNCRKGVPTILGDGERPYGPSKERSIRPDLLRYLILGGCDTCPVHEVGVQLGGAWVSGSLDLNFTRAKGATRLKHCGFAQAIKARQTRFTLLNLSGCHLPGLEAVGVVVEGDVFLDGLTSNDALDLDASHIGGQLSCNRATLEGAELKDPTAEGKTREAALNAQGARIDDGVFLRDLKSTGTVDLNSSQIGGQLSCDGAKLDGAGAKALHAQGARIDQGVFLHGLKSTGELDFKGADIGYQLACQGAKLDGAGAIALNAQGARIDEGVFLNGLKSTGTVAFNNSEIGGSMEFLGAALDSGGARKKALAAQRMVVKGIFFWQEVNSVKGQVDLNTARLGDLVDDAQSWDKVNDLVLAGVTYETLVGPLDLSFRKKWLEKGSRLNGIFSPQPYQQLAKFFRETGHRSEAREILIEKERMQKETARVRWQSQRSFRRALSNVIKTQNKKTAQLAANFAKEVPGLAKVLVPLFKSRFHAKTPGINRDQFTSNLIQRDFKNQLLFANMGDALRIGLHWLGDKTYRYASGYGYKPVQSLYVMIGLMALSFIMAQTAWNMGDFAPTSPVILESADWRSISGDPLVKNPAKLWSDVAGKTGGSIAGRDYETFFALYYAADVVIPLIEFGQTEAWSPSTTRGWAGWWVFYLQKIFMVFGWVVTALAAGSVTNLIRRDD
ncbi:MAG: hypothetical protein HWE23_01710 [Rhodobacteraceae bacterium]|nr:hypothetical protein [Paracoccaceae bacterium]